MGLKTFDPYVNTSIRSIMITWTGQHITMRGAIRCVTNDVVNECFSWGYGSCWALYVLMQVKGRQDTDVFLYFGTIWCEHFYVNITGSDNKTIPKNIQQAE